jgi:hypothetical protein
MFVANIGVKIIAKKGMESASIRTGLISEPDNQAIKKPFTKW